ncbi:MAG TPA: hypothetical protein VMQ54_13325, partial [Steroidobacteraceae bacterium]|nr:hypothetical protein [Steroidobacteraceae bacterium]
GEGADNIRKFLDFICSKPNYAAASRAIGIHESTFFLWLRKSADQRTCPPEFLTRWPNDDDDESAEQITFVQAVALARKRFTTLWEGQLRAEVSDIREGGGVPEFVVFNGALQFALDVRNIGLSDATMQLLYGDDFERHRFLLDADGNPQPLVVMRSAPAHQKIAMMRGLLPALYSEKSQVDVRHSGGVQIIGRRPAPPPQQIPATKVADEIVVEAVQAPVVAAIADDVHDADETVTASARARMAKASSVVIGRRVAFE